MTNHHQSKKNKMAALKNEQNESTESKNLPGSQ